MAAARPTTIAGYIDAAPPAGRAHLRRLHAILAEVAPDAQQAIKWRAPFFIEPRFLFSFNANKAHLNFAPSQAALARFRDELAQHKTTLNYLQVAYDEPLPEALIRKIAKYQLELVRARQDDAFW
ncbi:MAG: DUF1801 domain-containing protein [Proteobacteria bacterium]|nr:DUF1801 domain-containing protein [Pseudomonadota bacterium]